MSSANDTNMQKVFPKCMSLYSLEILCHIPRIIFFCLCSSKSWYPFVLSSHYTLVEIFWPERSVIGTESKPSFTNFFLEAVTYACWKLINRWHVWYWIGCQRITPWISYFCNSTLMSISLHQINEFVTNFEWCVGKFHYGSRIHTARITSTQNICCHMTTMKFL